MAKDQINESCRAKFNGVQVFSATMVKDREVLGDRVTSWIRANPTYELVDLIITQSSDEAFHCVTITVIYNDPKVKR